MGGDRVDEHAARLMQRLRVACWEFRNGQRTLEQLQACMDGHKSLFEGQRYSHLRTAMEQLWNKAEDVIYTQVVPEWVRRMEPAIETLEAQIAALIGRDNNGCQDGVIRDRHY